MPGDERPRADGPHELEGEGDAPGDLDRGGPRGEGWMSSPTGSSAEKEPARGLGLAARGDALRLSGRWR
jgi:hypothetical protein